MKMKDIIKKESNFKLLTIFILVCLFFVGCTVRQSDLEEENFKFIRAGMSTKTITKGLGDPNNIYSKREEIDRLMQEDANNSNDEWASDGEPTYHKFYKTQDELEKTVDKLKDPDEIVAYEYIYKDGKETKKWHVYFIDKKVVDMYFP